MAALLSDTKHLLWRSRDVDLADQGDGVSFFFYFLGEKAPVRVAKVPALTGSRLLFCTLMSCVASRILVDES